MSIAEYDGWIDSEAFSSSVAGSTPFCCRRAIMPERYEELVLTALGKCGDKIDVSCCEDDEVFNGNPLYREKVDIKAKDFADAWKDCRAGKAHWILDAGLKLYLSQCCFACKDEPAVCDIILKDEDFIKPPDLISNELNSCKQSNLWINLQPAVSTLHYDAHHNLLMLVEGTKEVHLISPYHTARLNPVSASDENPNHSKLQPSSVDTLIKELHDHAFTISLQKGDVLFIPQGWWHQVRSGLCGMAINFWFENRTQQDDVALRTSKMHKLPFELRQLIHELSLSSPQELILESKFGLYIGKGLLNPLLFEKELLKAIHNSGESKVYDHISPSCDDAADTRIQSAVYFDSTCGAKRSLDATITSPAIAEIDKDDTDYDLFWLEFVNCDIHVQNRLWIPFATKYPQEWIAVLLSLPPRACAHLLTYWDTLTDPFKQTDDQSSPMYPSHCNINSSSNIRDNSSKSYEDLRCANRINSLEDFFHNLFAPCNERVPEVRRHLIQQKNRFNETRIRKTLAEILGMSVS